METNLEVRQGEMVYDEGEGWMILYKTEILYQLHPDDVEDLVQLGQMFDNITGRVLADPVVKFHVVEHQKLTGVATYAKLIHNKIEQQC